MEKTKNLVVIWFVKKWENFFKNGKLLDKSLLMAHAGFELATFALLARRSNQLS